MTGVLIGVVAVLVWFGLLTGGLLAARTLK